MPFYGFPQGDMEPDWSKLDRAVAGHMAEHDDFFGPEAAQALEAKLQGMGKDVTLTVHPGTGHAFMGPHNALGTLDESWPREIWPGASPSSTRHSVNRSVRHAASSSRLRAALFGW